MPYGVSRFSPAFVYIIAYGTDQRIVDVVPSSTSCSITPFVRCLFDRSGSGY
jgi:hypothetical protein